MSEIITPEARAERIVQILDVLQTGVYPTVEAVDEMRPQVDVIRARYMSLRGRSFDLAYRASRSEFIAASIREAENAAIERAAAISDLFDWRVAVAGPGPSALIRALKSEESA